MLRPVVEKMGLPLAVYHDRHGIFERRALEQGESLEEQLLGREPTTQVGRLLQELGIESIPARSPQAKGRIERLFGTFQDRLGSELRLAGVQTLEEANRVLRGFLPRFNRRFAVPPAQTGLAYHPIPSGVKLEEVFCFKYYRTVGADNVVALGDQRIQIYPCNGRQSYYRARVEIQERMNGSLAIYYKGKCLATRPAPAEAPVLRVQRRGRLASRKPSSSSALPTSKIKAPSPKVTSPYKPGPDHPWRKLWKRKTRRTDIFTEQLT